MPARGNAGSVSLMPAAPRTMRIVPPSSRRCKRAVSTRAMVKFHSSSFGAVPAVLTKRIGQESAAGLLSGAGRSMTTPARLDSIVTSPVFFRILIAPLQGAPPDMAANTGSRNQAAMPGIVKLPCVVIAMVPSGRVPPFTVNPPPRPSPRILRKSMPRSPKPSTPLTRLNCGKPSSISIWLLTN